MSLSTIAAALQNEMKDSMTVVATTTFVAPGRLSIVTGFLQSHPLRWLSTTPARLADGLGLESTLSITTAPQVLGSPAFMVKFGDSILA